MWWIIALSLDDGYHCDYYGAYVVEAKNVDAARKAAIKQFATSEWMLGDVRVESSFGPFEKEPIDQGG